MDKFSDFVSSIGDSNKPSINSCEIQTTSANSNILQQMSRNVMDAQKDSNNISQKIEQLANSHALNLEALGEYYEYLFVVYLIFDSAVHNL